jgi:glycosyltransferase involved in cell wall biosynthesis
MEPTSPIEVIHLQRKPTPGWFSVERLFEDVRSEMPGDIRVRVRINQHPSQGIFGRLSDALAAWWNRSEVNHVLGDVHYLAWFLPRRRTVLTVLDCVTLERLTGWRRRIFWFLWYWWPLRRSRHVTVISEYSAEALRRWTGIEADRIHVIPPPLSPEFEPKPRVEGRARPRLLHIGTTPNKNLPRVIEAIDGLDVTLAIVGDPDEAVRDELEKRGIDHEIKAGLSREELVDQYRQADAIVFASTYEGFGLPIIEGQAVGRPVVAGDAGAMPEAAGGAACLVDPFSVDSIRAGIERVLKDQDYAAGLVERGFENAKRYSPVRLARDYAKVYRLAAGADGTHGDI